MSFTIRPITSADSLLLGEYFLSLSPATVDLYGPHPFDQQAADQLCAEIDTTHTIRLIAVLLADGHEKVVAYSILQLGIPQPEMARYSEAGIPLTPASGCLIAPSVADAYQNQGLGKPIMEHVFEISRRLGLKYVLLMAGVFAHNQRAVHFYEKMGFRRVGTFVAPWAKGRPSYDMIRYLGSDSE